MAPQHRQTSNLADFNTSHTAKGEPQVLVWKTSTSILDKCPVYCLDFFVCFGDVAGFPDWSRPSTVRYPKVDRTLEPPSASKNSCTPWKGHTVPDKSLEWRLDQGSKPIVLPLHFQVESFSFSWGRHIERSSLSGPDPWLSWWMLLTFVLVVVPTPSALGEEMPNHFQRHSFRRPSWLKADIVSYRKLLPVNAQRKWTATHSKSYNIYIYVIFIIAIKYFHKRGI